ncbi:MAG: hypothetical protein KKI02_06735 [Planctomycetes bacterium]|nr:hypothetical protein [Planctomycetota bacterium]
MRKRSIMVLAIAGVVLGLAQAAQADTYQQLKACLRNCINTTEAGSWARLVCVLDCYAAWADQKVSINVDINPGSTGFGELEGHTYLLVDQAALATVVFDVLSGDPLERIDLILVNDEHNPDDPDFGILLGSDNDGGDGWSVTFDPAAVGFTPWSGVLVGEAHFTGHDLEIDGDVALVTARTHFGTAQARLLRNGVTGDGELHIRSDGYGAVTVWTWTTNYDLYDPIGDDALTNCSFAASTFVYSPVTEDRLALGQPGRDLDTTYNVGAGATLSYEMVWPLVQWDSNGTGYNDTSISTFRVYGGNGGYNLIFDLIQTVSEPVQGGISTWNARYTITNIAAEPASFLIERHDDLDIWFDASAEDCAGTASVGAVRNVYMREADTIPNHENLVVALSSPTPGYVYCAARSGFDPDGAGPDPNMVYGTDYQIWDNYGVPTSWQDYTAGIGYNMDGILGEQRPPGSADPYDGFMLLQWELALAPGEAAEIDVVTTYGSETPIVECPGDLDGDGDVDLSDLAQLLGNYGMTSGATYEDGDLDGDGDVDLSDLAALLGVYGTTC